MIKKDNFIWILCVFCLAHFLFWLAICFPGVLYGDNAMMLAESFPGAGIGDQHSVMYIWMLRICHNLFGLGLGYPLIWGLFFWHLGIFFFTLGLYALRQSYWVLLFVFAFSDFPFINFALPHLQLKDFTMSAVLFGACGILFWISTLPRGFKKNLAAISAIACFFLAITFRHNAIFAFVPLAFLFVVLMLPPWNPEGSHKGYFVRLILFSSVLILGLFFGKSAFDRNAGDYENYFVHGCIFSFDLAGISVNTDEMQIPKERLLPGITMVELKKVFNTAGWDPLWGGWGSSPRILKGGENKEELAVLGDAWVHAVRNHFGAYLKHRWDHFGRFIKSKNEYLCICEWPPEKGWQVLNSLTPEHLKASTIDKIPVDAFRIHGVGFLRNLEAVNKKMEKSELIGLFFLRFPDQVLIALTIMVIASAYFSFLVWRRPDYFSDHQKKIILFSMVIFLSGWCYFMAYFFVSISSDWRYIHWSSLSFWIGACLFFSSLPYSLIFLRVTDAFQKKLK